MSFHPQIILLGLAVMLSACGPELIYEDSVDLGEAWSYDEATAFEYQIEDTTLAYDLSLTIDHLDTYGYQNAYALFLTAYPNGLVDTQAVSLELADRSGQWLGDCDGPRCQLEVPLQDSARFPERGAYGLTLVQHSRRDSLSAITGIGFRVSVAE